MIDGMPSPTFSIATLPPPQSEGSEERREKIIRLSRERYCRPREVVEDKIARWAETKKLDAAKSFKPKEWDKPKEVKPLEVKSPEVKAELPQSPAPEKPVEIKVNPPTQATSTPDTPKIPVAGAGGAKRKRKRR